MADTSTSEILALTNVYFAPIIPPKVVPIPKERKAIGSFYCVEDAKHPSPLFGADRLLDDGLRGNRIDGADEAEEDPNPHHYVQIRAERIYDDEDAIDGQHGRYK